jgi:hypothetical protein
MDLSSAIDSSVHTLKAALPTNGEGAGTLARQTSSTLAYFSVKAGPEIAADRADAECRTAPV